MREPARPEAPPPRPLPPARAAGASTLIAPLVAAALLPPGWMFIAHAHRWHLTPSVIVLCLAWTAVVGAGYALVRAGNAFLPGVPEDWFTAGGPTPSSKAREEEPGAGDQGDRVRSRHRQAVGRRRDPRC
ncbi:MAG: hypothetical protein IPH80_28520 [Myxococcales bacterium]|nr:hypothetical protein [Myxococcales bacterium]